jgi:phage gpG-like protein
VAKRRSKEQIQADKIIRKRLLEFGQTVWEQSTETSRVAKDTFYKTDRVKPKGTLQRAGGELRDSQNFRMLNDTTLICVQTYYGAFNYPKGESSGEKNALLIAINENLKENIDLTANELLAEIISPWT